VFVSLFSESAGRAVVAVAEPAPVLALCQDAGVPCISIGKLGGVTLSIEGVDELSLSDLRVAHSATLPGLFA
jgi:phosphoribosylformylglycinamidine synthase